MSRCTQICYFSMGFAKNQLSMLAWRAHRNARTEAVFTTGVLDIENPPVALEHTG
jgi:hypothetical protein